jgi:pimeloyl-ACP methyl ester carboxylesterase
MATSLEPSKVRQMITVAIPHPASLKPSPLLAWKIRHFFLLSRKRAAEKIRKNELKHIDELVHRWSPAWQVPPGETDAVKTAFREPGCLEAALGYYRAFKPGVQAPLRKPIQVPSVAFAGATDIISRKVYDKAKRFYAAPHEIIDMPGGHFMHREDSDRFVSELVRVVAAAPPAQAAAADRTA